MVGLVGTRSSSRRSIASQSIHQVPDQYKPFNSTQLSIFLWFFSAFLLLDIESAWKISSSDLPLTCRGRCCWISANKQAPTFSYIEVFHLTVFTPSRIGNLLALPLLCSSFFTPFSLILFSGFTAFFLFLFRLRVLLLFSACQV